MNLLQRIFGKQLANSNIFTLLTGTAAPEMKEAEYLTAYKGWVFACVNARARDVATLDLHLMRKTARGLQEVDSHIALNLLNDVNSFMSSSDLWFATQAYLDLHGNTFWYMPKGKVTRKPAEIWLLDPSRMIVVKSATDYVKGYVYVNEKSEQVPFDISEIIHFKTFNPANRYRGMGIVQAAALAIDTDRYSAIWNRNFFYNSAVPNLTLEFDGTLSEEQYARIKNQWESKFKGLDNAHKFAILEGGVKAKPLAINQRDMDYLELRRFSRDEILALFNTPKTVLGLTEDVNRANAEATDYVFAKRVIKPSMQFIVDRLNEFYLPLFGEDPKQLFFTFTDPVERNIELDLNIKKTKLGGAAYSTINEVRSEDGLPPIKGGDELLIPFNLSPLGAAQSQEPIKSIKPVVKDINHIVEKRIRFIASEIDKRKDEFGNIILKQKKSLLNKLKDKKSVIKKEDSATLLRLLFENWDDWIGVYLNSTEDSLKTSVLYAGKQAVRQVGADISFDLTNPRVLDWLAKNALLHAESINETLKDDLAIKIMDGVEQGQGAKEIAKTISTFIDDQAEWRSLRIARTEVISGYAQGSLEGYRQTGVVKGKKWLTAGDDKVDDECIANEEQGVIGLEESFKNGGDAPPVHPNCRCVLQPEV